MPEKPKKEKELTKKESEIGDESAWSRDQKEKKYYYDDDTGYEIYNADEDDEEEDEV